VEIGVITVSHYDEYYEELAEARRKVVYSQQKEKENKLKSLGYSDEEIIKLKELKKALSVLD